MRTINASQPPVHWTRRYAHEIGVGLILLAIFFVVMAAWAGTWPEARARKKAEAQDIANWKRQTGPPKVKYDIVINPRLPWTNYAGIKIEPGEWIDIKASGNVKWTTSLDTVNFHLDVVGPEGANWKPSDLKPDQLPWQFPMKDANCGSLIMRIDGLDAHMFYVGTVRQMSFIYGGKLEFMVNSRPQDLHSNSGEFRVRVERR